MADERVIPLTKWQRIHIWKNMQVELQDMESRVRLGKMSQDEYMKQRAMNIAIQDAVGANEPLFKQYEETYRVRK